MSTTTIDIIDSIKRKGSFPTSNELFSNTDYLNILNDEVLTQIVPMLVKLNEEYFLTYKEYSVASGTSSYRIPSRSVASGLRDVQLIDSAGNVQSLIRLQEDDRTSNTNGPRGYYLKGNQVILSPSPTSSGDTLRLAFLRRPSKFVLPSACAVIQSINTTLNQIVVTSLPSAITVNSLVDFVQAESPYDIIEFDYSISNISGTTLTFTSIPNDIVVGDYISLASQSCVAMVPEELIPVLVQAALATCLTSKKDTQAKIEIEKLEQMKQVMTTIFSPRVKSNDIVIKSTKLLNYFRR